MERKEFENYMQEYADRIEEIRLSAHSLHQSVNQTYGNDLPYGYHLDMVVNGIRDFGHLVCVAKDDVLPLFFGGYYHDSIEDARLTYNDVLKTARGFMTEEQALMATEIVYALTNDKGRTRAERAGERYYKGIQIDEDKLYSYQIPYIQNELFIATETITAYTTSSDPSAEVLPEDETTQSISVINPMSN